ncbi:MAG: hypothetical protein ACP5OP_05710 [Leptospirillia bacterium]
MALLHRGALTLSRILSVLLLLFVTVSMARAACPPGLTPFHALQSLSHAIGRLNRFFDRMEGSPSFNYDRMLYLVEALERREKVWSQCQQGERASGEQALIEKQIAALKGELVRFRSLPAEESSSPREAIARARRILSRIPVAASLPRSFRKIPASPPPAPFLFRPPILLAGLFFLGAAVLLVFGLRLFGRKGSKGEETAPLLESFRRMGSQWKESVKARSELLEAMKSRIGQGKSFVRIRAQLYLRDEKSQEWRLSDEISQDEGGFLRSFGDEAETIVPEKIVEEVALGEGEIRTRLVVPMGEEDNPSALLVVDALTSPEVVPGTLDPSGLLSLENFRERLFEIAHRSSSPVSILSFAFDASEGQQIIDRTGEEAEGLRSFVVREATRLIGPGTLLFGEAPGTFHVILAGKEEKRAWEIVEALSKGLGPSGGREGSETLERPWFRRILVARTRWRTPEVEGLDAILARIRANMKKLRDNPAIQTVNDA